MVVKQFIADTIEEALFQAHKEWNVPTKVLTHTVVGKQGGFLGMAKKIIVDISCDVEAYKAEVEAQAYKNTDTKTEKILKTDVSGATVPAASLFTKTGKKERPEQIWSDEDVAKLCHVIQTNVQAIRAMFSPCTEPVLVGKETGSNQFTIRWNNDPVFVDAMLKNISLLSEIQDVIKKVALFQDINQSFFLRFDVDSLVQQLEQRLYSECLVIVRSILETGAPYFIQHRTRYERLQIHQMIQSIESSLDTQSFGPNQKRVLVAYVKGTEPRIPEWVLLGTAKPVHANNKKSKNTEVARPTKAFI
jgi:predicted RNA-binding protein Jag